MRAMNQKGFSLLELMISTAALSIGLVTVAAFSLNVQSSIQAAETKSTALSVNQDVTSLLYGKSSWKKTLETAGSNHPDLGAPVNSELACIRDNTPCTPGEHPLSLYDSGGSLKIDSQSPDSGFSRDGSPCRSNDSTKCAINVGLTWTPACPNTGECIKPTINVKISILDRTWSDRSTSDQRGSGTIIRYVSMSGAPSEPVLATDPNQVMAKGTGANENAGCLGKRYSHRRGHHHEYRERYGHENEGDDDDGRDDDNERYSSNDRGTLFDTNFRSRKGNGRCIAKDLHKRHYEDRDDDDGHRDGLDDGRDDTTRIDDDRNQTTGLTSI